MTKKRVFPSTPKRNKQGNITRFAAKKQTSYRPQNKDYSRAEQFRTRRTFLTRKTLRIVVMPQSTLNLQAAQLRWPMPNKKWK
jgi:hypothetical protein